MNQLLLRMVNKYSFIVFLCFIWGLILSCDSKTSGVEWKLYLHLPDGSRSEVATIDNLDQTQTIYESADAFDLIISIKPKGEYSVVRVSVNATETSSAYVSLAASYVSGQYQAFNFNGPVEHRETYRQSPHDVNAWIVETIPMQSVPVIALKSDSMFWVAVSDSPFKYQNFTSQTFYPDDGIAYLSSGDNGQSPGIQPDTSTVLDMDYNAEKTQIFTPGKVLSHYHEMAPAKPHEFEAIVFKAKTSDYKGLRKQITINVADHFSDGRYKDYFGALAFTTAYFNLRTNDSGKSKYWVIPAVEYGNTQYGRDAFWISMMLDPQYSSESLKSELIKVNHFAEYPLFAIIWAYRSYQAGYDLDMTLVQNYVDAVEARVTDHAYYSYFEGDGRLDFQYWGDLMAFEKHDVISYNQGLFAIAINMALEMDLKVATDVARATQVYVDLFNQELGFMPVSQLKAILSPDAILPDLLSQMYLGQSLLPTSYVQQHFDRMVKYAKTDYGFKVVSTATGDYLPPVAYDIPGYDSQVTRGDWVDGEYFRGGSYFLYDNLFLLTAHLHGIESAEELIRWRVALDFKAGSTTYEHLNTITGKPNKPNMGWNVAIYALWRQLVERGKADPELFDHIDKIVMNQY